MPATPKALRAAPARTFENYILTYVSSNNINLSNVPENKFVPAPEGAGVPYADDQVSTNPIPIGFDFLFDGITYKSFAVCTNGWMALVDPVLGTFNSVEVMDGASLQNERILPTFTSNAVVLAPWFDDLRNLADDPNQQISSTVTGIERYSKGFQSKPISINKTRNVLRYANDNSSQGRKLIVRWSSLSNYLTANAVLHFEVIISENGTIEFRYKPKQKRIDSTTTEGATIGIFMPNGTNRFRDFSYGLGYRDYNRTQYKYGGVIYSANYLDTDPVTLISASYSVNLNPVNHWPGHDSGGAAFIFTPPKNRRKILIKNEQRIIDSQITYPEILRTGNRSSTNKSVLFDDRRTLIFSTVGVSGSSGSVVNYPSKLNRFYGGTEPGITSRQDLFAGDFEITASVSKGASDQFVTNRFPQFITPFSEDKLYENDPTATSDFFTSGSKIELFGLALKQPLKSKTHIKFSLPVEFNVSMPGNTSSIYYYNINAASWNIPENSSYSTENNFVPAGTTKGDLAVPDADIQDYDSRITEDFRGFGAIGNFICSGSVNRYGVSAKQTDILINSPYTVNNINDAMGKVYDKTITNNEDYRASPNETFNIPIKQPFLIERAVIEIPVAFGDGWFKDKTKCFEPYRTSFVENTTFDFGGPSLTIALFNQFNFGSKSSRRDLILTGTITHTFDNSSNLTLSNNPPDDTTFLLLPVGSKAYGANPSAIITPASSSTRGYNFTGSVVVKTEAQSSNGVMARYVFNGSTDQALLDLLNAKELELTDKDNGIGFIQSIRILSINNFGRASTGFDPSGRSIFGKELISSDKVSIKQRTANPFYLTGALGALTVDNRTAVFNSLGLQQFNQVLDSTDNFKAYAVLPLEGTLASPYLVYPGDQLTLAIAKTRPTLYANTTWAAGNGSLWTFSSGNIKHDVQLITGSINITFYGSLIKEGSEYHDPLNQEIGSVAVHEIAVGGEPVLDQFDCEYKEQYVSGTYDSFIAGDMISSVNYFGTKVFVTGTFLGFNKGYQIASTGTRGRLFSKNNARTETTVPGTTSFDYNTSLSYALQPFFEKAGTVRVSQHTDSIERYWDSVMPSISECFASDGKGITVFDEVLLPLYVPTSTVNTLNTGFMFFVKNQLDLPFYNHIWSWAYPFEPRYSKVAREKNMNKSFIAKFACQSDLSILSIEPQPLQGFFFGPIQQRSTSSDAVLRLSLISDVNIKGVALPYITSSAGSSDTMKALYGFGDDNNVFTDLTGSQGTFGINNFPTFRAKGDYAIAAFGSTFHTRYNVGPIIRGWKYGVYSGLPAFNKSYFRLSHYGQFRDMLEQRHYTKFYNEEKSQSSQGCVTIRFVDALGKTTNPERTWSQNLSLEATSSVPYFDGEVRNRSTVDLNVLNSHIITLGP